MSKINCHCIEKSVNLKNVHIKPIVTFILSRCLDCYLNINSPFLQSTVSSEEQLKFL